MRKPIPEFKNEEEERAFWAENDSSDYMDWSQAKRAVFHKLRRVPANAAETEQMGQERGEEIEQSH